MSRQPSSRTTKIVISVFLGVFCSVANSATVWDLQSDWSDQNNPNGPWSYNQGSAPLPLVPSFTWAPIPGQPAWAPSNNPGDFLPVWLKARTAGPGGFDFLAGDVLVHTTDGFNGARSGLANVTWTSPFTGTADISGSLWNIRNIGRSNTWQLLDNGSVIASGFLASGDGHGRLNPETFAFTSLALTAGDTLELLLSRNSGAGDFVGIDFAINAVQNTTVPEPKAFFLVLMGLVGIAAVRRRSQA